MFLGQNPSGPEEKTERGELFPPPVPCMQNDSACRRRNLQVKQRKNMQGERAYLARRRRRFAGAAVAWLVDGGSGRCCGGSNGGERDLFLVAFSSVFFFVFGFGFFVFGLFLLSPLFRALSLFSFLSPAFFLLPLSPLRYFSPPSPSSVLSIYRKQNGAGMPFVSAPSITQRLVGH